MVSDYAFVNAKLRARIGIMRTSGLLDEMIKAPSLVEAVSKLDGTRFQHIAEIYRATGDLQQAELQMIEEEIATSREIAGYLPEQPAEFLITLLEKTEIDNVKNAIRLWYSEVVRHHHISYRSAYVCHSVIVHKIDYDRIINAGSYQEMLKAFDSTPYKEVVESFSFEALAEKGLFSLEIALDHLWFSHLKSALSHLRGWDKIIAERIYRVDVDLKNILMLMRYSYYHHLEPKELKTVIIPMGYIAKEAARKGAFDSEDPIQELKAIVKGHYPQIMEEIDSIRRSADDLTAKDENANQIVRIEAFLADTRQKEYLKLLRGHPFTMGIILAYFFLYKHEDAMVSAVLSSKHYKWNESRIRGALGL